MNLNSLHHLKPRHREALAEALLCHAHSYARETKVELSLAMKFAQVLKGQDFGQLDESNRHRILTCIRAIAHLPYRLQTDEDGNVDPVFEDALNAAFWFAAVQEDRYRMACAEAVEMFTAFATDLFSE